jgi:hypothetical protein
MYTNQFQNMTEIMNIMRSSNPQMMVKNMLEQSASTGDPMARNLLAVVNSGNDRQLEEIARNVAREKGIDFDKEFNSFKQMFRL